MMDETLVHVNEEAQWSRLIDCCNISGHALANDHSLDGSVPLHGDLMLTIFFFSMTFADSPSQTMSQECPAGMD